MLSHEIGARVHRASIGARRCQPDGQGNMRSSGANRRRPVPPVGRSIRGSRTP
ncbi:hypothetical protein [Azospirillum endophyticum]